MATGIDINVLRALSTRKRYQAYRGMVPDLMLDDYTVSVLKWFALYFKTYEEHVMIQPESLMTLIRLRIGDTEPESVAFYERIAEQLDHPIDEDTLKTTLEMLEQIRLSGEAGALIARYNKGEEVDIMQELRSLVFRTQERIEKGAAAKWADGDPLQYFEAEADDTGLQFTTFPQFVDGLKGLRPGKNVAVSFPTDAGKTSLLCQIAVDMACQAWKLKDQLDWLGDRPLLYLINEGTAEAITPRIYQTALHKSFDQCLHMARAGSLMDAYLNVVGRRDAIRLVNIHGKNTSQVYRIIEAHNPYMVITDMTGRIRAASNTAGGKNDVGQVEEVWNFFRESAAILHFIHMGTVQVSAEGFDQLYPPLSALQDSKVGIQTTLDLCIMGGRKLAEVMESIRGISTPKNKLARSGHKSMIKFETVFNPDINKWDAGVANPPASSNPKAQHLKGIENGKGIEGSGNASAAQPERKPAASEAAHHTEARSQANAK